MARACLRSAGDEVVGAVAQRRAARTDAGDGVAIDLRDAPAVHGLVADVAARGRLPPRRAQLSRHARGRTRPRRSTTTSRARSRCSRLCASARREHAWSGRARARSTACPISCRSPRTRALAPANPYAVSKAAGDLLAGVYAERHGLAICRARPFNHAGPGQLPIFIVSSLAQQAAEAHAGADVSAVRIVTGNPDARRDFTDVRDVVRAYRLLARPTSSPGVYNVSSGVSVSAAENVRTVAALLAPIEVEHVVDPARVRATRGDGSPRLAASGSPPPPAGGPRSHCGRRSPTRSPGGSPS